MDKELSKKVLSISVAAYNTEATIRETITSFISNPELLEYFEIIVVNDGSTDATSSIAHEFESAYPDTVVVIDKPNGGYGSTINASIKIARGKYYRLVDGDDWIDTTHLRDYLVFLSKTDADMVVGPYYEVRSERRLIDNHPEIPPEDSDLNELKLESLFFVMHEITVKTDKLRDHGLAISEHCFYTDTEYNVAAFQCTKTIARFNQPLYCYRLGVNGQSMSLAGIRKHCQDMINVSLKVSEMLQKSDPFPALGTKEMIIQNYVKHSVLYATYGILAIEDTKQSKKELAQYEKTLKTNFPEAYKLSNQRKFLRLARSLLYKPFFLTRRYAIKKYV